MVIMKQMIVLSFAVLKVIGRQNVGEIGVKFTYEQMAFVFKNIKYVSQN